MSLPIALILFRFLTALVIFFSAYYLREDARSGILVLMYLGLLSDIFDGIIARNQNIATAKLRRLDSQTDMIFWLSIGFAVWFLHPETIRTHHFAVAAILGMELTVYVISFLRFGKETCLVVKTMGLKFVGCLHVFNRIRVCRYSVLYSTCFRFNISY